MLIYVMNCYAYFLFALQIMIMSLIGIEPDFTCQQTNFGQNGSIIDKCTFVDYSGIESSCGSTEQSVIVYNKTLYNNVIMEVLFGILKKIFSLIWFVVKITWHIMEFRCTCWLSDRFGRRPTFLSMVWLNAIASVLTTFAPTYYFFLVTRFLAGGINTIGFIMQIESVAPSFRSIMPLFATIVWVSGYMSIGVLHLFVYDWRWFYFIISAPGILTFTFYWLCPETLHWSITNENIKKTKKVTMNLTYWNLSFFSVDLVEEKMVGYFLSGLVEVPAGILAIFLLHFFGRKTISFYSLLSQAIFMFLTSMFPAFTSQYLLIGEMAPTSLRNVFFGSISFLSKIGSILSPYLNFLKVYHPNGPSMLICFLSFLAAFVVLCLPETKDKTMPRDVADFVSGPVYELFKSRKKQQQNKNNKTTKKLINSK